MVKIHYALRRKAGLSAQEFTDYWFGAHAALVRQLADQLGVIHYVQHHAVAPDIARAMQAQRGTLEPFDGIAEIGFASEEALEKGNLDPQTAQAQRLLAEDEARFIDIQQSVILFTTERQVI
jgi:hypothetical protein